MARNYHYENEGGVFYPILKPIVEQPEDRPILKYGFLRGEYIENHNPHLFMELKVGGTWNRHLADMQERADAMIAKLKKEMLEKDPGPDRNTHPWEWVQHMNMTLAQAEEIMYAELLYV